MGVREVVEVGFGFCWGKGGGAATRLGSTTDPKKIIENKKKHSMIGC